MAIPTTQDVNPDGTAAQNALLYQGQRSVVAASPLAFASLANGQTFVTLDAAGATLSRTINAPLAASTTLATFCAALALQLNMDGTGYNWTATATTVVGTAKLPGSAFNSAPTGTALVGGVGSISTYGEDPYNTTPSIGAPHFVYDETLTSVGAAVNGDIVRRTAAGAWTPASSDTAANCAGNLGIYEGGRVVPIVGNLARLNFAAAPTLNVPCYLSTVAGKATSTVPSPRAITVYLGTPYADLTVATDYAAKVGNLVLTVADQDLKGRLTAMACQDLGGVPADYDIFYDSFFSNSFLVGFDSAPPIVGWPAVGTKPAYGQCYSSALAPVSVAPPAECAIALPGTAGINYWQSAHLRGYGQWAPGDRSLWVQRVRFTAAGTAFALCNGSAGFGIFSGGTCDPNRIYFTRGPYSRFAGPDPTAVQRVDVAPRDTDYHWYAVEFMGDGTWRWAFDWGSWSAPISDVAGTGGYYLCMMAAMTAGTTMIMSDLYWATKRF